MLLEMALAEFSDERDWNEWSDCSSSQSPDSGESPVDSPARQIYHSPYERTGSRLDSRHININENDVELSCSRRSPQQVSVDVEEQEEEEQVASSSRSHAQEVPVAPWSKVASLNRSESKETFYWEDAIACVPFEWEKSPRTFGRMVQESRSFGGRSSHPEPLPHALAALRPLSVASPKSFRSAGSPVGSPIRGAGSLIGGGIGGKVKSILSGRSSKSSLSRDSDAKDANFTALPVERVAVRAVPDFPGRSPPKNVDRVQLGSSDDGEGTSPVSTLDLPMSPLTPSYSSSQYLQGPQLGQESAIRRQNAKLAQARPTPSSHWTNTITSEELPAVMEEDEEDLESVYGYHTMEFQTMDSSPTTSDDRRMRGRDHEPSKSWSAPISRQHSSLRPSGAQSRGRRRSDFDWPEDFDERPEEVVKEVDESLWAFSPVNSTFVFSGNDNSRSRSSPGEPRVNGGLTPPTSSPGLASLLDHIALRASLMRSASSKPAKSTEADHYPRQRSSRLRQYHINGDDDYASGRGHPMKRSSSCLVCWYSKFKVQFPVLFFDGNLSLHWLLTPKTPMIPSLVPQPFFSLCSTQRPTTISFSQRLGPNLSNIRD